MAKKTSWALIIVGVLIFAGVLLVGLAGIGGYLLYQQFSIKTATVEPAKAEEQFSRALERFKGQKPYIELDEDEPVVNRDTEKASAAPIQALHLMAYNPRDRKTLSMEIPMWLVRLGGENKNIELTGGASHVRLRITPRDLERHGPGLILDHIDRDDERILVWAE